MEITATGDPPAVLRSLSCDDDSFERLNQPFEEDVLSWGDLSGSPFELRTSDTRFGIGDEVTIVLTNTGQSTIKTGGKSTYSIQLRTEAGWQDVRGALDGVVIRHPDILVRHEPGEGFEWTFELTGGELADDFDSMAVCPALQPGRYRFVYWGLRSDATVGVSFDVVDSSDRG